MPELPEVETVARRVRDPLVGRKICASRVLWQRTLGGMKEYEFRRLVEGKRVVSVSRRAKYIIIALNPAGFLVVHLRMSGDLIVCSERAPLEKHLRVAITLSNGRELRFVDTRKFGRFVYCDEIDTLDARLGQEPLDESFDIEGLYARFKTSRRVVKAMLLDQEVVAGLGNIYAVESLWRARVHPLTVAQSLSRKKLHALMEAARDILKEAISAQGTDLGDGVWKTGGFVPMTYGRAGEPCHHCGRAIKKIRVAQRGTEYCGSCQRR